VRASIVLKGGPAWSSNGPAWITSIGMVAPWMGNVNDELNESRDDNSRDDGFRLVRRDVGP